MLTDAEIDAAAKYVEDLRLSVHEMDVPNTERVRAAGSCFSIAQEHHHAIVKLIEEKLYASAFALMRSEFESHIRGEWLDLCASDAAVAAFLRGREPPKIDLLITELELLEGFKDKVLSQIKQDHWKVLCAYTHSGGLHVQRRNTGTGIEANYSRDEVLEVLKFAEMIASLSVLSTLRLGGNQDTTLRVLKIFKRRMQA